MKELQKFHLIVSPVYKTEMSIPRSGRAVTARTWSREVGTHFYPSWFLGNYWRKMISWDSQNPGVGLEEKAGFSTGTLEGSLCARIYSGVAAKGGGWQVDLGKSIWSDAGLTAEVLEDPEAWMPIQDLCCFLETAIKCTGHETLGLDAGIAPRRQHSEFSMKLLLSPSLYETLSSVCKLSSHEDTSAHWRLVREGPVFWMRCKRMHGSEEGIRHVEFFRYACMLEIVRFAAGGDWLPPQIEFQSSFDDGVLESPYLAGSDVRFGMPLMQFAIPPLLLSHSLNNTPSVPLGQSRFTARPDTFQGALLEIVRYQVVSGKSRLEDTARALGLSKRTLQRRLADQGVTYAKLLLNVRIDTAKEWLSSGAKPISEIASRLGYRECTNFSRAFRRICGVTPREFRQLMNAKLEGG